MNNYRFDNGLNWKATLKYPSRDFHLFHLIDGIGLFSDVACPLAIGVDSI